MADGEWEITENDSGSAKNIPQIPVFFLENILERMGSERKSKQQPSAFTQSHDC